MTTSRSERPPFAKVLVANRGEIACRVLRTARRLGIATVAVFSEADEDAPHAALADEAVAIGPAPSRDSYLSIERVLAAARRTGAEAVHPGFGFLAENAAFARAVEKAGIAFIGPGADAIAAMGDKIESKRIAAAAGVAVVPGHPGPVADADAAVAAAERLGFPVMLKASAGGGGKGMRAAADADAVRDGFESARNEARAAFGDDRMLVEKFIAEPRHIEIQLLADSHGAIVHLGERECSIQRRCQKVVEEAPSPFVDADMREAMGAQAIALARAVDYRSAGTVEFVAGGDGSFYFLEMNTRLQVEHPVTEMTRGVDIVEHMIRIAAGEPLALRQEDVAAPRGWAVEARVCAEDPARGFLPSTGRLRRYREPPATAGLRVDSGVAEGGEIAMHYDSMIAKVIACGADRAEAIDRLAAALDGFEIAGPRHNLPFLRAVLDRPAFRAGRATTAFVAEEFGDAHDAEAAGEALTPVLAPVAALVHCRHAGRAARVGGGPAPDGALSARIGAREFALSVRAAEGGLDVEMEGRSVAVRTADWRPGRRVFRGSVDGRPVAVQVARDGHEGWRLVHGGASARVLVRPARAAELAARMPEKTPPDTSRLLLSPMPGLVVSLAVAPGQAVKAGEPICVVDAMKMENVLRAERDGVVAAVEVAPGDSVRVDQVLVTFAREGESPPPAG